MGDLIVEAVGIPASWSICQDAVKPGGHISILGVHGKPATINLERMWYQNFTLSAGMVHTYTTPMLMQKILKRDIDVSGLISHKMHLSESEKAYTMFKNAADFGTLKILMCADDVYEAQG